MSISSDDTLCLDGGISRRRKKRVAFICGRKTEYVEIRRGAVHSRSGGRGSPWHLEATEGRGHQRNIYGLTDDDLSCGSVSQTLNV
jgi:hypothetical protein